MLKYENNAVREKSLKNVKADAPNLKLWIHDLACKANFADGVVKHRVIDRFHIKNHVPSCKCKYGPDTISKKQILNKFKVKNKQICEQMWKPMNKHYGAMFMHHLNYRAYWRHFCKYFNSSGSDWAKGVGSSLKANGAAKAWQLKKKVKKTAMKKTVRQ